MGEDLSASLSSLMTNSISWNLSNDDALLEVLKSFSQNFLSRTNSLLDKMDQLSRDTASVQIRLDTANNNFMLLSNIKFIEARVYEDNEEEQQDNSVTEDIRNEDNVISEALRCGTDLVNTAFEKVAINDSDSESEEEGEREVYVLQPKNSYHLRSLPNVIGTKEWFSDDKIGLGDEDLEEGVVGDLDTESESEDEEEDLQGDKKPDVQSDYSDSENEENISSPSLGPLNDADRESSDGDSASEYSDDDDELFRPKTQLDSPKTRVIDEDKSADAESIGREEIDEVVAENELPVPKKTSFADELALKLGGSSISKTQVKPKSEIHQEEQEDREDQTPVGKKSALFDSDSDSDDDLFSPKPPLPKLASKPKAKVSAEAPSLVDQKITVGEETKSSVTEDGNIQQKQTLSKSEVQPIAQVTAKSPAVIQKNIFGDSSDEEDIFADLKVDVKSLEKKNDDNKKSFLEMSDGSDSDDIFATLDADLKQKTKLEDIKKDDGPGKTQYNADDDLFSNSIQERSETNQEKKVEAPAEETGPKRKAPVGGVSLFAGFNPANIFKKKPISSDDEPDDDKETIAEENHQKESENAGGTVVNETLPDDGKSVLEINDTDDFLMESRVEVLTTITKSRPKVGGRRRPPTRSARSKDALTSVFQDTTDGALEDREDEDQKEDGKEKETRAENKPTFKPPTGGVSLFGNMNPKDLLKKKPKVDVEDETLEKENSNSDQGSEKSGSSLFENLLPKKKTDNSAINSKADDFTEESVDLFPPKMEVEEAQDTLPNFEPPPLEAGTAKKINLDIFDADSDDDDLFSDLLTKNTGASDKAADVNNLFGDDDDDDEFDDLFSSIIKK